MRDTKREVNTNEESNQEDSLNALRMCVTKAKRLSMQSSGIAIEGECVSRELLTIVEEIESIPLETGV